MDDLTALEELTEGGVVAALRDRHSSSKMYTRAGALLLAVNPNAGATEPFLANSTDGVSLQRGVGLPPSESESGKGKGETAERYSMNTKLRYLGHSLDRPAGSEGELNSACPPPHVYEVAAKAFQSLIAADGRGTTAKSHSILVSGESGSGKTEAARSLLGLLMAASSRANSAAQPGGFTTFHNPNTSPGSAQANLVSQGNDLGNLILSAGTLLESLGNAKTKKNNNSSRFGKWTKLYFRTSDGSGRLLGAKLECFLLEKSRVSCVPAKTSERTFHVFYQLCAGANDAERRALRLPVKVPQKHGEGHEADDAELDTTTAQRFYYLSGVRKLGATSDGEAAQNESVGLSYGNMGDAARFEVFRRSLVSVLGSEARRHVLTVLAAVLHLGNIEFDPEREKAFMLKEADTSDRSTSASTSNDGRTAPVEDASALLGLTPSTLSENLCVRSFQTSTGGGKAGGSFYRIRLNRDEAFEARDALAKALYARCFDWVVTAINKKLAGISTPNPSDDSNGNGIHDSPESGGSFFDGPKSAPYIGILDIFGFEVFRENEFEQFLINYANERLQQLFVDRCLREEQAEYSREGIEWTSFEFADNSNCLVLLEARPSGILSLLDEECLVPQGSDGGLLTKLEQQHSGSNAHWIPISMGTQRGHRDSSLLSRFCVRHYAGDVEYNIAGFLDKNKDLLHDHLEQAMRESTHPFIAELFGKIPAPRGVKKSLGGVASDSLQMDEGSAAAFPRRRGGLRNSGRVPHRGGGRENPRGGLLSGRLRTEPLLAAEGNGRRPGAGAGFSRAQSSSLSIGSRAKKSSRTICGLFRSQLENVLQSISGTEVHFVRCISPNDDRSTLLFDEAKVRHQLRCAGLLDQIRIRQHGYQHRRLLAEFLSQYRCLIDEEKVAESGFERHDNPFGWEQAACKSVLLLLDRKVDEINGDEARPAGTKLRWALGSTRVYLSASALQMLDSFAEDRLQSYTITVQSVVRCVRARQLLAKLHVERLEVLRVERERLETQHAAVIFQALTRAVAARWASVDLREQKRVDMQARRLEEARLEAELAERAREEHEALEKERQREERERDKRQQPLPPPPKPLPVIQLNDTPDEGKIDNQSDNNATLVSKPVDDALTKSEILGYEADISALKAQLLLQEQLEQERLRQLQDGQSEGTAAGSSMLDETGEAGGGKEQIATLLAISSVQSLKDEVVDAGDATMVKSSAEIAWDSIQTEKNAHDDAAKSSDLSQSEAVFFEDQIAKLKAQLAAEKAITERRLRHEENSTSDAFTQPSQVQDGKVTEEDESYNSEETAKVNSTPDWASSTISVANRPRTPEMDMLAAARREVDQRRAEIHDVHERARTPSLTVDAAKIPPLNSDVSDERKTSPRSRSRSPSHRGSRGRRSDSRSGHSRSRSPKKRKARAGLSVPQRVPMHNPNLLHSAVLAGSVDALRKVLHLDKIGANVARSIADSVPSSDSTASKQRSASEILQKRDSICGFNELNENDHSPLLLAILEDETEMTELLLEACNEAMTAVKEVQSGKIRIRHKGRGSSSTGKKTGDAAAKALNVVDGNKPRNMLDVSTAFRALFDINTRCFPGGNTLLHICCSDGAISVSSTFTRLLSFPLIVFDVPNDDGVTPLHYLAAHYPGERGGGDCHWIFDKFIRGGARVNAKALSSNETPLHRAALNRHADVDVAKELVRAGADVNAVTSARRNSESPLHFAVHMQSELMVLFLIREGADVNLKSEDGNTPYTFARDVDHCPSRIFGALRLKNEQANLLGAAVAKLHGPSADGGGSGQLKGEVSERGVGDTATTPDSVGEDRPTTEKRVREQKRRRAHIPEALVPDSGEIEAGESSKRPWFQFYEPIRRRLQLGFDPSSDVTPPCIFECLEFLAAREAWESPGLFRESGYQSEIKDIYRLYKRGAHNVDLDSLVRGNGVNSVAGVLKQWLRGTFQPIFPYELFPALKWAVERGEGRRGSRSKRASRAGVQSSSTESLPPNDVSNSLASSSDSVALIDNEEHSSSRVARAKARKRKVRTRALASVVQLLPPGNRAILGEVLRFLNLVDANREVNLMHAGNLAIVFAPTLLRRGSAPGSSKSKHATAVDAVQSALADSKVSQKIVGFMIRNFFDIFKDDYGDGPSMNGSDDDDEKHKTETTDRGTIPASSKKEVQLSVDANQPEVESMRQTDPHSEDADDGTAPIRTPVTADDDSDADVSEDSGPLPSTSQNEKTGGSSDVSDDFGSLSSTSQNERTGISSDIPDPSTSADSVIGASAIGHSTSKVENQSWFLDIDRTEAESLLRSFRGRSMLLVRPSSQAGCYAVSVYDCFQPGKRFFVHYLVTPVTGTSDANAQMYRLVDTGTAAKFGANRSGVTDNTLYGSLAEMISASPVLAPYEPVEAMFAGEA